jgi:glutamate transport system substrate-binding protein
MTKQIINSKVLLTLLTLIMTAFLALALAGCGETTTSAPQKEAAFKIGIKFDAPGMSYEETTENGVVYTGLDVDFAKEIVKKLGYNPEKDIKFVKVTNEDRFTKVSDGDVDFVISSTSISAERETQVTFAGPYLQAEQRLLVREDSGISSNEGVAGKIICTSANSSKEKTATEFFVDSEIVTRNGYPECIEALNNKEVDAVSDNDFILATGYSAKYKEGTFRIIGDPIKQEELGIAVKKGNLVLCEKIQFAMESIIREDVWKETILKNTAGTFFYKEVIDLTEPTLRACK